MANAETPTLPSDEVSETEKASVIKVNFINGTITDKIEYENDGGVPKFFREMAKYARKHNIKSAMVMVITEDNHVDWMNISNNEHHMALAALCLDDMREDLKAKIFGTPDTEEGN